MTTIVIQGAKSAEDVPGLAAIADKAQMRFAMTADELRAALPGADVLLGWDFAAGGLEEAWENAGELRWIQWTGAGVNAALFPGLAHSDVVLTNARGVFDRAMAEYTLGQIIAFAKRFHENYALQARSEWRHRMSERIEGARVLVVGVGSIGREIARLLRAVGMVVEGVGRTARGCHAQSYFMGHRRAVVRGRHSGTSRRTTKSWAHIHSMTVLRVSSDTSGPVPSGRPQSAWCPLNSPHRAQTGRRLISAPQRDLINSAAASSPLPASINRHSVASPSPKLTI